VTMRPFSSYLAVGLILTIAVLGLSQIHHNASVRSTVVHRRIVYAFFDATMVSEILGLSKSVETIDEPEHTAYTERTKSIIEARLEQYFPSDVCDSLILVAYDDGAGYQVRMAWPEMSVYTSYHPHK